MKKLLSQSVFVRLKSILLSSTVLALVVWIALPYTAHATGTLTSISDTVSRLQKSTAANHTIKFTTPTGIANTNTIQLTFPAGFTMGASLTGVTIADGAGADNAVTSAAYSANVLTITASSSSTVAAGHAATIKIPSTQITNPSSAGTNTITIGGSFADAGKFAIVVLDSDQVSLTANVNPSLTFSISDNLSAFGDLSTGSVTTSGTPITLTVGTNAQSGYTISVFDAGSSSNPGLYNTAASHLIASADATLAIGTEGYGIQATSTNATIASRYDHTGNNIVGGLAITPQTLASYSSSMNANQTVTVTHKAAISSWTQAGAYSDTLTYLATGNY